jgi:hypothetical protein
MKRKIVIVRYGAPQPLIKESELINKITGDAYHLSLFVPLGRVGVISLVYSDLSTSEIADKFKKLAAATSDTLPVMVGEMDHLGMHLTDLPGFDAHINAFNESVEKFESSQNQVEIPVDTILDIANEVGGFENLSEESKLLIKKFTKKA